MTADLRPTTARLAHVESTITPQAVAQRYGVGIGKVLGWISAGELGAINVASKPGGRPRWRIRPGDLLAFEMRRANRAPVTPIRRRRVESNVPYRF